MLALAFTNPSLGTVPVEAQDAKGSEVASAHAFAQVIQRIRDATRAREWERVGWTDPVIQRWLDVQIAVLKRATNADAAVLPVAMVDLRERGAKQGRANRSLIVSAGDFKGNFIEDSVILVDGEANIGFVRNSIIIARDSVRVSHARGNVVVAGKDIEIAHDNSGRDARGSVLIGGGSLKVSHATGSIISAGVKLEVSHARQCSFINTHDVTVSHRHDSPSIDVPGLELPGVQRRQPPPQPQR